MTTQRLARAKKWWDDLSIFKKLYGVVGVMALLIALELFTLRFAMHTLSAVRAFVGGEGLWSKAQKDAVLDLQKYALTSDRRYYLSYREHLRVPLGDHKARLALEQAEPDVGKIYEGFIEGRIHSEDIDGVIALFERFRTNRYLARAIGFWVQGDDLMAEMIKQGDSIHELIQSGTASKSQVEAALDGLDELNDRLTNVEDSFSASLGEGSRWLESTVLFVLLIAVLTVESTGLFLTFSFSRHLSRGLGEINDVAKAVGKGRFDQVAPVRSGDELGQLAESLNLMASELESSIGKRAEAENASQWKSLFLANVSHEIRTPLGAIIGFTELLKDPHLLPDERDRYLDIVHRTGENLNRIVSDILDLSKVEAGRLEIVKTTFSTRLFFSDLLEVLNVRAVEKDVNLSVEPVGTIAEFISTDANRLRQILVNLIGNAIKFTPERGSVRLKYQTDASHLRVTISDTGPGIAADQQSRLFQPFAQASAQVAHAYGGTGLGLFLSRRLARALGGDVALAHSVLGQGSTFTVTIRLDGVDQRTVAALQAAATPNAAAARDLSDALLVGLKVLVVDDAPDNQLLIHRILSKRGAEVILANNGQEGVDKALATPVDLVLMDMQMPVLDGYAATQELRRRGFSRPIVALTAQAMKDDRDKALAVGCDDHLTKPVAVAKLVQIIHRYSAGPAGATEGAAQHRRV